MIAVLGGLGAAAAWALSTLCSSRSSRLIDPVSVVAWVMVVGLVLTAPIAAAGGVPARLGGAPGAWLLVSGVGNVGGLLITYRALRIADVSLVAPVVSTEGAVAAVIAVIAGESLAPAVGVALAAIVVGIGLAARAPRTEDEPGRQSSHALAILLALAAAATFGTSLYATARAGAQLPSAWVALSARLIGTLALTVPLLVGGRLRLTRGSLPLVLVSGVGEVLGFYAYTFGSRHGIAVASVLSSQFAVLAAIGGYALFAERLDRVQFAGVCIVLVGVATVAALRA